MEKYKEELRTTRPIGVTNDIPIIHEEYGEAWKRKIDWSFFSYDANRRVYTRTPDRGFNPERDKLWVYTEEFMRNWENELAESVYVMREDAKVALGL